MYLIQKKVVVVVGGGSGYLSNTDRRMKEEIFS